MIDTNPNEFIWATKYRPRTVDDCILPQKTKDLVKGFISKNEIPHMIFSGGPGMGKTTLAYAIANELESDLMYINASLENGIDVLRTRIQGFASTVSLSDSGPKIVILDEADGTTPVLQAAFIAQAHLLLGLLAQDAGLDPARFRRLPPRQRFLSGDHAGEPLGVSR